MEVKTNKTIKVLRIIARLNIGGPAIHCILLTAGLNNDRFSSVLVSGNIDDHEGDMEYFAEEKNIKVRIIPQLGRNLSLKNDFIAFKKLLRLMKEERPDIIHTHTAKAGALGRIAGFFYKMSVDPRIRPKIVHTFHGHVFYGYFGKFKTSIFIFIERFLAYFSDKLIAVSEAVKEDLCRFKISNPDKIIVIKLGLQLDRLLAITPKENCQLSIGIIGRLVRVKNHCMFFNAIKRLKELDPVASFKVMVIGDGELRLELEHYVHQLQIDQEVVFVGWQKDLFKLYCQLDIIALTSLNEGTPLCLIEAMAAGRPVVATNVGGVKDLVDRERGWLVDVGDVDGFANALKRLIENSDLRRSQGLAGREFARNNFSKDRLIQDIILFYGILLKER